MSAGEMKEGDIVRIRKYQDGGFDFQGRLRSPIEVWRRAVFVRWHDGKPVVRYFDGIELGSKSEYLNGTNDIER